MGARQKGNPPRKRGPKPDPQVLPGKWGENVGKALKKPQPKGGWLQPPNKKGRRQYSPVFRLHWEDTDQPLQVTQPPVDQVLVLLIV